MLLCAVFMVMCDVVDLFYLVFVNDISLCGGFVMNAYLRRTITNLFFAQKLNK